MRVDGLTITIGAIIGAALGYFAVKHFLTQGSVV